MKLNINIKSLLLIGVCSISGFNCFAGGSQKFTEDTPIKICQPFEINNWTKKSVKFDVPLFGIEHQVRLALEVCAPCTKYRAGAGSNPVLTISVNGNSVTAKQLLKQPNSFKYMGSTELTWVNGKRWRVLYAQDFELVPGYKQQYPNIKNPYRYVIDITKFAKSGQSNEIIFSYNHSYKDITLKARKLNIIITKKFMHPQASEKILPAPTGALTAKAVRGKVKEPMKVFLADGGGIKVIMNNQPYSLLTKTTLPGGGWKSTQMGSKGTIIATGMNKTSTWQTPFYRIVRNVSVKEDHIQISDTITNTSSKLLGLWYENWLTGKDKAPDYILGGLNISGNAGFEESENPTACLQSKNSAIGILPESDIFQAHLSLFKKDNMVGLIDHNLGIESGKSVTMEWSIYPVVAGNYWDMINAIRRNWKVNFTIPGPFAFRSIARLKRKNDAEYIQWIKTRKLKMVCDSIPVYNNDAIAIFSKKYGDKGTYTKYAHGTAALLGTDFLKNVEIVRDVLKKNLPEVEYFFYFHTQISTIEHGPSLYDDSIIYDKNGTQLHYSTKFLKVYMPTLNNKYGKAVWDYIELIVDKMAMNVYWDEMCYSMQRMVYGAPWDGCTVELDGRFNVTKKITCVPLAMQPFKLKIIDYVKSKGKLLLGNSQAVTATMRKQQILRFVESGSYDNVYKTNIGSIIALSTHHPEKGAADAYDQVYNFLKRGALYYSNWSIPIGTVPNDYFIHYMFPTTPIEIYAGTIFAKERIITSKSGIYSLPSKVKAVKIVAINPQGLVVDHSKLVKEVKSSLGYSYEVRIPSNYIIILIRNLLK